jgi:hypothetical protein
VRLLLTNHVLYSPLVPMVVPAAQALQATCPQVAVATGTALADDLGPAGAFKQEPTVLTLPISEFGVCSCGFLVYPP